MPTLPTFRRRHLLWMAFFLAVLPWPLWASEPEEEPYPALAGLVQAGDSVTVTLWSGPRVSGVVIETTNCSLVLRTGNATWPLLSAAIKTLRRHQPRMRNRGAAVMLETAGQCDEIACLPSAFALVGIGAVIQGFDNLAHPPQVVYRAKRRLAVPRACPGALAVGPLAGNPSAQR